MNNEFAGEEKIAAGKYLVFTLGAESYGVPIAKVREIIRLAEITLVPQMPDYIRGVINLRGKIVPVMDLRTRFGFKSGATERTCIVVVQAGVRGMMGLVVDTVEDVLNFSADDISAAPNFGGKWDADQVLGMASQKRKTTTLLNLEAVCSVEKRSLANF